MTDYMGHYMDHQNRPRDHFILFKPHTKNFPRLDMNLGNIYDQRTVPMIPSSIC